MIEKQDLMFYFEFVTFHQFLKIIVSILFKNATEIKNILLKCFVNMLTNIFVHAVGIFDFFG